MAKTQKKSEEQVKDFSDFQSPHEASVERLVTALDRAYHRPLLLMWRAFLQGFMAAIGAVIGTAFIGIVSVYIIQALGGFDVFNPVVDKLQSSVQESVDKKLAPITNE